MRVRTIAVNTFKETVRDRILYSLLIFAIVMIGVSYFIAELSVGDFERIVINFGISFVHIFGALIAIFIGISLVSKEIEKKTIYSIISKPISRFEFLIGKFTGLAITLFVTNLAMTLGLFLTTLLQSGSFKTEILFVSMMIYLELLLLTGVAIFFSTITTPTLSGIFTLSVFLIGHVSPQLKYFAGESQSTPAKLIALTMYYLLPNLENFNFKDQAIYGVDISPSRLVFVIGYFLAYVLLLLLVSNKVFSSRDFK